jgi:uncharacterized membrane protein
MNTPRSQVIEFIEQGVIPAEKIHDALHAAKIFPDGRSWRVFIDHFLTWLGGLALAFAVMFFIAFNWDDLGRFAKFGMVEMVIVVAIIAYCRFAANSVPGKASLLGATICLGVLLALYGQTYQTGADPWQLFFTWAMLMLPWAVIGRFPAIWILWVALINIAIVLYYQTFRGALGLMFSADTGTLWLVFFFNTLVLAVWEFLAGTFKWLAERWAVRLLGTGAGISMTGLVLDAIFSDGPGGFYPGLAWAVWMAGMYGVYRKLMPDLFMLAGICLSGIVVSVAFLGKLLLENGDPGGFLLIAVITIGMGAGAALWLKNVHQEGQL